MSNNNNGLWLSLIGTGLAADRPQIPNVPAGVGAFWIATDTGAVSSWNGSAWVDINAASKQVATGITAATTQTLAAATQLSGNYANVSTVANIGDAVKLPAAVKGAQILVNNTGANPAGVFPKETTSTIDGGSAGAAATVTNAKSALFTCIATGVWQSIGMAGAAA